MTNDVKNVVAPSTAQESLSEPEDQVLEKITGGSGLLEHNGLLWGQGENPFQRGNGVTSQPSGLNTGTSGASTSNAGGQHVSKTQHNSIKEFDSSIQRNLSRIKK